MVFSRLLTARPARLVPDATEVAAVCTDLPIPETDAEAERADATQPVTLRRRETLTVRTRSPPSLGLEKQARRRFAVTRLVFVEHGAGVATGRVRHVVFALSGRVCGLRQRLAAPAAGVGVQLEQRYGVRPVLFGPFRLDLGDGANQPAVIVVFVTG
jgi:hypothetical protein